MNLLIKTQQVFRNALQSRRPIKYVSRSILVKSGLCSALTQKRNGYLLRFFPTIINGAIHFAGSSLYQEEEEFVKSLLRQGDWMIDVGCNIGLLSLAAKTAVGETGRCIAFEANPLIAHYARCNSIINGCGIEVVNTAVGDMNGLVYIPADSPDDESFVSQQKSLSQCYAVSQQKLDDLIPEGQIRLLKIDVEGYELNVLKGAGSLLGRCDFIWIEICESFLQRFGASASDLCSLMRENGFRLLQKLSSGKPDFREIYDFNTHDFSKLSMVLAARPEHIPSMLQAQFR